MEWALASSKKGRTEEPREGGNYTQADDSLATINGAPMGELVRLIPKKCVGTACRVILAPMAMEKT
jgi:hypothetical protein